MIKQLSEYITGVGAKRLSEVEVRAEKSNQHEFNGPSRFKNILGSEKVVFQSKFFYLSDEDENILEDYGTLTWYDSRENQKHRAPEYRFYYSKNQVTPVAEPGDLLIIAKTTSNNIISIITSKDSTSERQLMWLFGIEEAGEKFVLREFSEENIDIGFAAKYILSSIGIEYEDKKEEENLLELIIQKFGNKFPATNEFSMFARSLTKEVNVLEDPDAALITWMEKEELLFKTLEHVIVKEKLISGFGKNGADVEEFISFSLSVQNRRKSRAGFAFENHLSVIFDKHSINYSKGKITELNKKPDFIFPGIDKYHDKSFPIEYLTMLGLKTTAKDRWRQVLSESAKIHNKHLITLEPSISQNQTEEMRAENLNLVLPRQIISTYNDFQKQYIMSLSDFILFVKDRQENSSRRIIM